MPATAEHEPTQADLRPECRPYRPYGACADVFRRRDAECLLSGPAGSGKSASILNKIFLCAEKYPEARILICRKTRESMTQSTLVTWEDKVVPAGHPCLNGPKRNERKEYIFPNGSRVIVDGLRQAARDNTQKVFSTDYDLVYPAEATELAEAEWENLTTRLRNGKMPYQQILGDANPGPPTHWLKKRCDRGQCAMLYSQHTDNPTLWDHRKKDWTENGAKYIAKLQALTGARRGRLYEGKWVSAEGMVYENWNPAVNIVDRFDIPATWRRFLAIDFGYTCAFVCQWYALDSDDRLYLYREYVRTQRLVEDHARVILELSAGEPEPEAVICDHDAEGRATLERYLGRGTVAARKDVEAGIQSLEARLRVAGDGRPRFMVLRDSLTERDPEMEDQKKPIGFTEEVDGYCFNRVNQEKIKDKLKEQPIKVNDHSVDASRYCSMHLETDLWVGPDFEVPASEEEDDNPINWRTGNVDWRKGSTNWRKLSEEV